MKDKIKFKIDTEVLNNYVNHFKEDSQKITDSLKSVQDISDMIKSFIKNFPDEKSQIYIDTIKQIINANHGMISTKMIVPLNISRQYLSIMVNNKMIEKVSRGIYLASNIYEDSYFCFQLRYKKAIFSHMNALYFYGMTEEFPYSYTVTVPQNYHADAINEKCNVFYVSSDIYELGMTEVETPYGNKVKVYNKERCICDIIRSKGRMDLEQVKKTVKSYIKSNDKDMARLSFYSKKMGIDEKVMEMLEELYYE